MTESVEQMVSRIDERTLQAEKAREKTNESIDDIKDLLQVKCVEDEKKFGERPTRKEINKKIGMALIVLGLMVTIFFGAIKVAATCKYRNKRNR